MKKLTLIALSIFAISFNAAQAEARIEVTQGNQPAQVGVHTEMNPAQRLSYYFGIVDINSYSHVTYTVSNRGNQYIGYMGAYISGMDYRANTNCSSGLMPGQQCQFAIIYNPVFEGYHSGFFELYFSESNEITHEIIVDVWGEARRRW